MRNTKRKFFKSLIFLWWFFSFALLFFIEILPRFTTQTIRTFKDLFPQDLLIEDSWYGVYFKDDLVGYSNFNMKVLNIKEGRGFKIENRLFLTIPLLGVLKNMTAHTKVILFSDYSLKSLSFEFNSERYFLKAFLEKKSRTAYRLTLKTPTSKNVKMLTLSQKNLLQSSLTPIFLNYLPRGKRAVLSSVDIFTGAPLKVYFEKKQKENLKIDSKVVSVYKVEGDFKGIKFYVWVDKKGKLLKEKFLNFVFIKESPAKIFEKLKTKPTKDLILAFSVPTDKKIKNSRTVSYLKVEMSFPTEFFLKDLTSFRQSCKLKGGSFIIEVRKKIPKRILEYPFKTEFKEFLGESLFIKTSEKVKDTALQIIGKEKDSFKILEKLCTWVYKNIKKTPTASFPNTLDVLKLRQGDCNEHAVLLCGFLRSLGIPSYITLGLVYQQGRFWYHAWVSSFIGEWVESDPTFGQVIADATHIRLLKGDIFSQTEILKLLGKMKMEVLEYD